MKTIQYIFLFFILSVPCIAQTLDVLEQFDAATKLKDAMLESVKQNPQAKQWSGATENFVFGIGTAMFDDEDEKDITKGTSHLLAVRETLFVKVLLDEYEKHGLANISVLKTAIVSVVDSLAAKGTLKYIDNKTFRNGNTYTNIITADRKQMIATMMAKAELSIVKNAYYKELFRYYIVNEKRSEAEMMIAVYQNDLPALNFLYGITNQYENETAKAIKEQLAKHIERLTEKNLNLDRFLTNNPLQQGDQ